MSSVADKAAARHRVISEIEPRAAKAVLRKTESEDFWAELGLCLDYARREAGWNLDELAAQLPPPPKAETRDPRQVRRWIAGEERLPIDVVFAVVALRAPFVVALARLTEDFEEETTLRRRRRA